MSSAEEEFNTTNCAACGKESSNLKRCSACKLVAYCNKSCQKAHRRAHKELCNDNDIVASQRRDEKFKQHNVKINTIFDPDEDVGFMYSKNIAKVHPLKLEFISLNVHRNDIRDIGDAIHFLADQLIDGIEVRPYQSAIIVDTNYLVMPLEDDIRRIVLDNYACALHDESVELLLLQPMRQLPMKFTLTRNPERVFLREVIFGEKAKKIQTIRLKWLTGRIALGQVPETTTRHLDGNPMNCHYRNLKLVSLYEAFTHPNWVTTWDCNLEDDEVSFVKDNLDIFVENFRQKSSEVQELIDSRTIDHS